MKIHLPSTKHLLFFSLLIICCATQFLLLLHTDGTGGGGDSIAHFLIARAAPHNPVLYLDHWGKPLFTLLASPFALSGFKSVQYFNILITALACLFSYLTALQFSLRFASWVPVFYFFSAEVLEVTPASFTEPVFAMVFAAGIYLLVFNRLTWGVIVLSFLPFARSEGLVILCVLLVYLLACKAYRKIPLLFAGHVVFALAGMFIYSDALWVFTKIPYATLESIYGKGPWYHFLYHMYYISGPVTCTLALAGIVSVVISWMKNKFTFTNSELNKKLFLSAGMLLAFLAAHSIFWALGIFGSLGLTRVVVGIVPSIAILSVAGLEFLIPATAKKLTAYVILLFIIAGEYAETFWYKPTAVNREEFLLNEGQQYIAYTVSPYVRDKYADYKVYLSDIALSYYLDKNLYDTTAFQVFHAKPTYRLKDHEVIVWDSMWSCIMHNISYDTLMSKPYLQLDTCFIKPLQNGVTLKYAVFTATPDSLNTSHK